MDALSAELRELRIHLQRLIPEALEKLQKQGKIKHADPVDAVGLGYSSVGSDIYHRLSLRTAADRDFFSKEDDPDLMWNPAEFSISEDLGDLVDPNDAYHATCARLNSLICEVTDARPMDVEEYPEFDALEQTVCQSTKWLTEHWRPKGVPVVEHPIFFAMNHYQDDPYESLVRSVDPGALGRAGLDISGLQDED